MAFRETNGSGGAHHAGPVGRGLIPQDFLKVIAVWSLIPSYLLAGGLLGYVVDRWLHWWPYATGVGLIIALVFAVRDMMRLRDEF